MTAGGDAASGTPVGESETVWEVAARDLTPDKSLARVDARAQQILGTVSLIGAVLAGFGVIAGGVLTPPGLSRWVAAAAGATAILALLVALIASVLRVTPELAPGNLLEVEAWYRSQFRRARAVVVSGWLLVLAVALAAAAGALLLARGHPDPVVSVAKSGVGGGAKLSVRVDVVGAQPDGLLLAEVVGTGDVDVARLARGITRVGEAGTAGLAIEVPKVGRFASVRVETVLARRRCTITLPINDVPLDDPTSACR